jgi:hypothetical protein
MACNSHTFGETGNGWVQRGLPAARRAGAGGDELAGSGFPTGVRIATIRDQRAPIAEQTDHNPENLEKTVIRLSCPY